jgi:hypothetical protein
MTRLWLGLIGMLALAACQRSAELPQRDGDWVRAEGTREGKPMVWQMREHYTPMPTRAQLIVVSWHFASTRQDGQPDEPAQAQLADAEKRLLAALGAEATLVAVLDYDTQHDWYFYAADASLRDKAESVVAAPGRDVTVTAEDDSKAEFYRALGRRVK